MRRNILETLRDVLKVVEEQYGEQGSVIFPNLRINMPLIIQLVMMTLVSPTDKAGNFKVHRANVDSDSDDYLD